ALRLEGAAVAQPGNGVVQFALRGPMPSGAALHRDLLGPLRESLAPEGGSAVVERAPSSMKVDLDVWGPIEPTLLDIMTRLKREFDPGDVLNPGRFVGGL